MKISRWPPNLLKFHLFTHGCQLDVVIKASNYILGEAELKYTQQKCIIKQIGSSDILIIHCNKRIVGLIVQTIYIQLSG